ncbi:MAG: ketopantoate reductase family protein [Candidatus Lokiarchaeota archaeon]|nr:ketopantoate reductase family protein [Candidatus Lokiarchaeota archaeon]
MKILVYGAGVLGSLLASLMKRAGTDVSILARGQRLREIEEKGIVIENLVSETITTTPIETIKEKLSKETQFDLIIVIMQKTQVHTILPDLANFSTTATILFVGNNGTAIEDYKDRINPNRILLGFFSAGGMRQGHLMKVVFDPKVTRFYLGETSGDKTPRVKDIKLLLEKAGLNVIISENIDSWLKTHIAWVSPLANLYYMLKKQTKELHESSEEMEVAVQAVIEGVEVLKKLRYPILPESFEQEIADLEVLKRKIILMFQWKWYDVVLKAHVEHGVDEMRKLADEFQILIQKANIPTPNINKLYSYIPQI